MTLQIKKKKLKQQKCKISLVLSAWVIQMVRVHSSLLEKAISSSDSVDK